MGAIFLFQKQGIDTVNNVDSRDIKILLPFHGSSILKFSLNFCNCVGGIHMRGCFVPEITRREYLITLVILIYIIKGNYLISS